MNRHPYPRPLTAVVRGTIATLASAAFAAVPTAPAQGWEVDWNVVSRLGNAVIEKVAALPFGEDWSALSESYEVDWERIARVVERVLDGTSWEDAAALRPYVETALARMPTIEGGADITAWMRRRLEYLRVAEQVVREEKPRVPASVRPGPAPTAPRVPAPTVQPPVRHAVRIDHDRDMWIRRLSDSPTPFAQQTAPSLRRIFEKEGIPPALIWLAEVESAFNPSARSPAGAAGLYQFMPATAARFGLSTEPVDQRLDPELSAGAAARYLRVLYHRFSDWPLAVAAYNAGEGRVGRILQHHTAKGFEDIADTLPLETRMYVPRVAAVIRQREGADLGALPAPLARR